MHFTKHLTYEKTVAYQLCVEKLAVNKIQLIEKACNIFMFHVYTIKQLN